MATTFGEPPRLGPYEACSRFACFCERRWDQRGPWNAEERARTMCQVHGALRTGLFLGEVPMEFGKVFYEACQTCAPFGVGECQGHIVPPEEKEDAV